MTSDIKEALRIVAENEWQTERARLWLVELTPADAKTLFAAIKQLSGDSELLDHLEKHRMTHFTLADAVMISVAKHETVRAAIRAAIRAAMRKDGE